MRTIIRILFGLCISISMFPIIGLSTTMKAGVARVDITPAARPEDVRVRRPQGGRDRHIWTRFMHACWFSRSASSAWRW